MAHRANLKNNKLQCVRQCNVCLLNAQRLLEENFRDFNLLQVILLKDLGTFFGHKTQCQQIVLNLQNGLKIMMVESFP